jgi:hypothetical protein
MAIEYTAVSKVIKDYVMNDADMVDAAVSEDELKVWIQEAARELLIYKKHLLLDNEGNPRSGDKIIGDTEVDVPKKYLGALMHGALMFAFTEDQQRSSFERGQFYAQLGMGRG